MSLSFTDENVTNPNADMWLVKDDAASKTGADISQVVKIHDCLMDNAIKYVASVSNATTIGFFACVWTALYFTVEETLKKHDLAKDVIVRFLADSVSLFHAEDQQEDVIAYLIVLHETLLEELSKARITTYNQDGLLRAHQLMLIIAKDANHYDGSVIPSRSQEANFLLSATSVKRSVADVFSPASRPSAPPSNSKPPAPVSQTPLSKPKSSRASGIFAVVTALSLFLMILIVMLAGDSDSSTASVPTTSSRPKLTQKARPANGYIFESLDLDGFAPLTIETTGTGDYYFILDPITLTVPEHSSDDFMDQYEALQYAHTQTDSYIKFYVHAGQTFDIDVPLGEYEIYYAVGEYWYGEKYLFGYDTSYYKLDETFIFSEDEDGYSGWTIGLEAVRNGNLDSIYLDPSDFPGMG